MYKKVAESQTLLINQQSLLRQKQNQKVYKFGFGQSPFLPPQEVIEELQRRAIHKEYTSVQGDPLLRERIAAFHNQANGLDVNAEDILVAPGSKALLYTLLASFEAADFLIPAPAWVSYAPQGSLIGHHNIRVATSFEKRWRVTPDAIEDALRSKKHSTTILILNYPGNPDGLSYTREELVAIGETCRKHGIYVIADEIYGLLSFVPHHSLATIYPEGTFTTTGLSKWSGAGGWRLGVLMLNKPCDPALKKALIGIGSETYSCAPAPVQMAARIAYGSYEKAQAYTQQQIHVLWTVAQYCYQQLTQVGVKLHTPQGGFYLFPDFGDLDVPLASKGIQTSDQLCQQLMADTGVALLPGTAFGMSPNHLVARLSYVDFDDPLGKPDFDLHRDCPRIIEGIQAMVQWLKQ